MYQTCPSVPSLPPKTTLCKKHKIAQKLVNGARKKLLKHHVRKVSFTEFTVIIPGGGIPVWSEHEQSHPSKSINLPGDWYKESLRGLAFWAVFEVDDYDSDNDTAMDMQCGFELYFVHNNYKVIPDTGFFINRSSKVESDHLWLHYIPSCSFSTTRKMGG
ncbi:uncharacterized protein LOC119370401 [Jatropha curcas]|uniref:uncharacterized protein LOC119370401 n=1 Tax=Jatropha curcas TaxID=180498 RepID=UPI001895D9D7|nr:uncharacterized protein LOC119370401 [Jatropha curcas]